MVRSRILLLVVMLGLSLCAANGAWFTAAPGVSTSPVRDLSQQVWALQTLRDLGLTQQQLKAIRPAIPVAAGSDTPAVNGKVSPKYVAALKAMREGLLKNADDDQIDDLQEELDAIGDDEDVDIDDHVTVTDGARAAVGQFMRLLSPGQVAGYLTAFEDDLPDPLAILMDAAGTVRDQSPEEFAATAAATGEQIGILVAGIEPAKYNPVAARVKDWLQQCRGLSKAQLDAGRAAVEKSALALLGDADGFVVLRHWVERDLSELLANPQLPAIVDLRLQQTAAEPHE